MLRHIVLLFALTLSFAGFAGCTGDEAAYDQYVADYEQGMVQMQAANDAHEAAVTAAADLNAVATEEDDHYADMQGMMDEMMGTTESMEECNMMDSMDMSGMLESMEQEMEEHHQAMADCATLEEAMQEESAHQSNMDEMFESMDAMHGEMSSMMGMDMGC